MSKIIPKQTPRKMSLDEAVNSTMTPQAWKAYIEMHEMHNTRRDD